MASRHQVRGVLLEEVVLMLLRAAGYRIGNEYATEPLVYGRYSLKKL